MLHKPSENIRPNVQHWGFDTYGPTNAIVQGGTYLDAATANYPMRGAQHDVVNVRTLDTSGNGNNATWGDGSTAGTYPTWLASQGYRFDGSADYLDLGGGGAFNPAAITFMALMKFNSLTGNWIFTRDDNALGRAYALGNASNKLALQINGGGKIAGSATLQTGIVYTVAFTGSAATGYITYIDGVQDDTGTWTAMNTTTGPTNIGRRSYGGFEGYLNMDMYCAVVFPSALSASQIADLSAKLKSGCQ